MERALILTRDGVLPNPLHKRPAEVIRPTLYSARTFQSANSSEGSDRTLILEALDQVGWVVGGPHGAGTKLGLKRTTLLAKMKKLGISRPIHQDGIEALEMPLEDGRTA